MYRMGVLSSPATASLNINITYWREKERREREFDDPARDSILDCVIIKTLSKTPDEGRLSCASFGS